MSHFEIVRTEAEQPWHARFVASNGRILWTTENYARRGRALRAIEAIAGPITHYDPPEWPEVNDPTEAFWGRDIRDVDERARADA